jgi:hypothetical protein
MGIRFEPLHGQQRGQRTRRSSYFHVVFRKALDFSQVKSAFKNRIFNLI